VADEPPRRDAWGVEHDRSVPSAALVDFSRPYEALRAYCRATGATLRGWEHASELCLELALPTGVRILVVARNEVEVAWRLAVHLCCCGPEAPQQHACVCLWPGGDAIPDRSERAEPPEP
jgi:hypothetical protein